ncbi:unnamed protein product [Phytophthora fragariaefolia]|uniref:Unnamed protein product n=1 Tax=Phytophthora fragariaefolia TaxID=1490495 RepID=A0A9W6TK21_9STRA|nr:unnamed protein product [Phytophthora fragariaefolia]
MQLAVIPGSSHGAPQSDASGSNAGSDGIREPDPKRPRLDDYEVALATADVPLTYREAMASRETANWKDADRAELRAHI